MALVGIARLAAQSELLEAKRSVEYFEIPARSILNRTKPNMPFRWTINPYRGCEIGCKYCYARYAHEFMELEPADFEDKIYAKSRSRPPAAAGTGAHRRTRTKASPSAPPPTRTSPPSAASNGRARSWKSSPGSAAGTWD